MLIITKPSPVWSRTPVLQSNCRHHDPSLNAHHHQALTSLVQDTLGMGLPCARHSKVIVEPDRTTNLPLDGCACKQTRLKTKPYKKRTKNVPILGGDRLENGSHPPEQRAVQEHQGCAPGRGVPRTSPRCRSTSPRRRAAPPRSPSWCPPAWRKLLVKVLSLVAQDLSKYWETSII